MKGPLDGSERDRERGKRQTEGELDNAQRRQITVRQRANRQIEEV